MLALGEWQAGFVSAESGSPQGSVEGVALAAPQAPGLWRRGPRKLWVAFRGRQVSPATRVLHRAKWHSFLMGGTQSPAL